MSNENPGKILDIESVVLDLLQEPKSSSVDGTNITNQSVDDLIKADQLLQNKKVARNPFGAIGRTSVIPPSATGR